MVPPAEVANAFRRYLDFCALHLNFSLIPPLEQVIDC
jgi:hypothetical protein